MTKPRAGLIEIRDYLAALRVNTDNTDCDSQGALRLYRRFHALLLWEIPIDRDVCLPAVRLYMRESLADCASGYMLNFMSGYKPARLCLRGAIENAIRAVTASTGVDILEISSVSKLVDSCRTHWATTPEKLEILNNLYAQYGELCNTVHSTSIDYMSLRVPFEKIFEPNVESTKENQAVFDVTFKLISDAYYAEFNQLLKYLDFRNADYIRDAVEADLKRAVAEHK